MMCACVWVKNKDAHLLWSLFFRFPFLGCFVYCSTIVNRRHFSDSRQFRYHSAAIVVVFALLISITLLLSLQMLSPSLLLSPPFFFCLLGSMRNNFECPARWCLHLFRWWHFSDFGPITFCVSVFFLTKKKDISKLTMFSFNGELLLLLLLNVYVAFLPLWAPMMPPLQYYNPKSTVWPKSFWSLTIEFASRNETRKIWWKIIHLNEWLVDVQKVIISDGP